MNEAARGFRSGPAARRRRVERALAAGAVVLALGGLVLARPEASSAASLPFAMPGNGLAPSVALDGPDARFRIASSHGALLARGGSSFLEVRATATARGEAEAIAPASLAIVLDRSGSMSGEKIREARRAIGELVDRLRDADEVTLVAYSDAAEVLVPLTKVGPARARLRAAIAGLDADGGTNIAAGLSAGVHALDAAGLGHVRRVVLVSDGIDDGRAATVSLAKASALHGVVTSSLGVGLDFDEAYMTEVSRVGHGNFAFVRTGADLSKFLAEEARQTARTTVDDARVRLELPPGARVLRVVGAESDGEVVAGAVELRFGQLFAGDEQRAVVEVAFPDGAEGERFAVRPAASYVRVADRGRVALSAGELSLRAVGTGAEVDATLDGAVFASVTSALASARQLEAAEAFAKGDVARARSLVQANVQALGAAQVAAPAPAAKALSDQLSAATADGEAFAGHAADSVEGKVAAKSSARRNAENLKREAFK